MTRPRPVEGDEATVVAQGNIGGFQIFAAEADVSDVKVRSVDVGDVLAVRRYHRDARREQGRDADIAGAVDGQGVELAEARHAGQQVTAMGRRGAA